ncbi:MAG TPA: UDP-4-amino-4-deoxy-L-arabinose aminotransferase [Desulfobacterales bacterium]|nr:UDP-4-amino-4-deoxy-L-arabinose aminotransferase [Desulfobacterales bacterium]HIP38031.1 UDP-4-amino-4-deoxy-L-arabinose aminotransferase [Desulfocapsa sulfexigens]
MSTETFLPFSRPEISEDEIKAVADVLRSGWITTGPKTAEFEQKFCEYCGAHSAVALSSATGGMHLLLKALAIGPGDEVVTPSMTWVSTVNMIVLSGATPVFADIDRETMMVTRETIEPCLNQRTKLIVPVHFAGASVQMKPIRKLAKKHGITLVEDAAHGVGTEYMGEKIGSRGTVIFSFHPIKNMTTGEGGMFCSDDRRLLERIRSLRFHGLGVDAHDRIQQGRSPQAEVLEPGYKYNMTDIAAQLGLSQLARLEEFIARRTELAQRYIRLLADIDEINPLELPRWAWDMRHSWHLFIVRLDIDATNMSRDTFMARLQQLGIGSGIHFRAVHEQKYYLETLNLKAGSLPATEWNSKRICSLPLFPSMNVRDVATVVRVIKEILSK